MKSVVAIVLLATVLTAEAKVAPASNQEPATQDFSTTLSDFITQAQANINNMAKQIQEQLNVPDQETIADTIKTQSTEFAKKVQDYVNQVTADVKARNPELEKLWDDVKGKLNKVVDDINAQIPNAQEQAAQLQAKFQEGVQTLVKESDKAAKAIGQNSEKVQEDIAKFTKQAIDIAVQATQSLNTQIQQAAAAKKN